jgi:hypothetical protein
MNRNDSDLPAPPRLLLWLAVGLFILIVVLGIGGILYYAGGQRLNALIPYIIILLALIPILSIGGAILYRKRLPRQFLLWLVVLLAILGVSGALGAIYGYREVLPPRYQEEFLTYAPFMRTFMRPTPAGGLVPTVASTSAISPNDLLGLSLASPTDSPAPAATTEEPAPLATSEPATAPTITVTSSPTPLPPTDAPTAISAAPTELPVSVPDDIVNVSSVSSHPASAHLFNLTHYIQEWNNCGPTNITMALSFFGWQEDPGYAQELIRPNVEDKNVSPNELVAFVNQQSFVKGLWRIGGDLDLLRSLIASNFPVVIETGGPFAEGYDWIGHYQTVVGYDDNQRLVYLYDSYLGSGAGGGGLAESYDIFDERWQDFNRTFIVLYEPDRESTVAQLLGDRATPTGAAQIALDTARAEATATPGDAIPWYNMGTAFLKLGMNEQAASAYYQASSLGLPFRINWYQFGMFEAYFNTQHFDDVRSLAQSVINDSGGNVEEAYYWQGRALAEMGQQQDAARAFSLALGVNPLYADARAALDTLNA